MTKFPLKRYNSRMRLAKCDGERCGANFPSHARFCPRCGKAFDVVVPPPQSRRSYARPCRGFPILRVILLCWLVVFAVKSMRRVASQHSPATPAPVIVSSPSISDLPPEPEVAPDVTTLDNFIFWRASHSQSKQARKSLEGRDIRWTGTLKKTLLGRFDVVQDQSRGKGSVRMLPVTDDAKQDLRRFESGAHIEIEGVLMDDRSLHLVTVRQIQ